MIMLTDAGNYPAKIAIHERKTNNGQVVHITRPFKAHRSFSLDGIKKEVPEQISGLCFPADKGPVA